MSIDGERSRIFRQTVTMEVVWAVEPGAEPPHTDWEAVVRDAVCEHSLGPDAESMPAFGSITDIEELEARP